MNFEETMALVLDTMQTERSDIINDILELRLECVEDQFDTGYNDGLDDVITMLLAKNEP